MSEIRVDRAMYNYSSRIFDQVYHSQTLAQKGVTQEQFLKRTAREFNNKYGSKNYQLSQNEMKACAYAFVAEYRKANKKKTKFQFDYNGIDFTYSTYKLGLVQKRAPKDVYGVSLFTDHEILDMAAQININKIATKYGIKKKDITPEKVKELKISDTYKYIDENEMRLAIERLLLNKGDGVLIEGHLVQTQASPDSIKLTISGPYCNSEVTIRSVELYKGHYKKDEFTWDKLPDVVFKNTEAFASLYIKHLYPRKS